jgi:hypothetical protein
MSREESYQTTHRMSMGRPGKGMDLFKEQMAIAGWHRFLNWCDKFLEGHNNNEEGGHAPLS